MVSRLMKCTFINPPSRTLYESTEYVDKIAQYIRDELYVQPMLLKNNIPYACKANCIVSRIKHKDNTRISSYTPTYIDNTIHLIKRKIENHTQDS